tara:strand:+ start:739 stop:864 length:126 start_codon:yes stop_codon:yes gene_type:complete
MEIISQMCFLMAALTFGALAGHYITKDYYIKQPIKIRKEHE